MKNLNFENEGLEDYIEEGLKNGIINFNSEKTKITYFLKEPYQRNYKNPEEKVRAACFCELVLKYKYPIEKIKFEVLTRPDKDRVDIVVYKDKECKEVFIIIECKKDFISDVEFKIAIEQAYSYANYTRTCYMMVMAGNTALRFNVKDFPSGERQKNIISDLPIGYELPTKFKYYKQAEKNLSSGSRDELIKIFKKCHDTIWQGGKLSPTAAFDEMSKLLFCKLKDETETIPNDSYQFQIGTNESSKEVFQRINAIYIKAKHEDEEIFKEDICVSPEVMFSCVQHLQKLAINAIDLDAKGVAFEKFMQDFFKGKNGQFFTPRNIVCFAVEFLAPKGNQLILDPACGSGGFLLNAMDYVRNFATQTYTNEIEIYKNWHGFAKDRLFGIEINDQIARVCKMNMILHDDGHSNIISADSLEDIKYLQSLNNKLKKNYFDLILTNPPFGAIVSSAEKEYLQKYILGKNKNTQKTEILFIERCIEFLKPETGKMAIVLPDGILNNSSLQYVRDYILRKCKIMAIVSLPQLAFSHYGAGVKSSLLFLQKKGEEKNFDNYSIFMAIAEHIGYDATGRETPDKNDLPKILQQYKDFTNNQPIHSNNKIFLIHRNEIEERLDPSYYKPEFLENMAKVQKMPHKQLGELVQFSRETRKKTKKVTKPFYIEIGGVDIQTGEIENVSELPSGANVPSSAQMVVRENDILISKVRPNRGAICFIDKHFDGFIASTGFAVIREVKDIIDRKYLLYALRLNSTLNQFEQRSSGGNYPTITKSELEKVSIPLLSKDIQNNIVQIMDHAYFIKKKKESEAKCLLNKIDDYVMEELNIQKKTLENIFTLMVEDLKGGRFDVEYQQFCSSHFNNQLKNSRTIKELIIDYKKGFSPKVWQFATDQIDLDQSIPFVRISDLKDINSNKVKRIEKTFFAHKHKADSLKKGELLYTITGTIGLTYLVTKEKDCIVSNAILRLVCENIELAKFLKIILSLKVYKEIVNIKSSGSVIKNLHLNEFLNLQIPFPSQEKRDKIILEVEKIQKKVQNLKQEANQIFNEAEHKCINLYNKDT